MHFRVAVLVPRPSSFASASGLFWLQVGACDAFIVKIVGQRVWAGVGCPTCTTSSVGRREAPSRNRSFFGERELDESVSVEFRIVGCRERKEDEGKARDGMSRSPSRGPVGEQHTLQHPFAGRFAGEKYTFSSASSW
uniref:Secreted protein n=1 Tax=Mycena chlorophos TaxID=658473 RepID=A0ABQ0MCK4_MYCCL|nr:predicted protein [Mycena chlorophos]